MRIISLLLVLCFSATAVARLIRIDATGYPNSLRSGMTFDLSTRQNLEY